MRRYIFTLILAAIFAFNGCSDDGDDDGDGVIPITFLDKYNMSEWQRNDDPPVYLRFEKDYPIFIKIIGKHVYKDCYELRFKFDPNREPVFNILELREDYIKYEVEYFLDGYSIKYREEHTFFIKENGEMQEYVHQKEPSVGGVGIKVEHGWEKAQLEINPLMCD